MLALISGILALIFIGMLLRHRNTQNLVLFLMETLVVIITILILVIEFSQNQDAKPQALTTVRLMQILYFLDCVLIFLFPVFNHALLNVKNYKILNIVWGILAAIDAAFLSADFFGANAIALKSVPMIVNSAMMQGVFVYVFILLAVKIKDFEDTEFKNLIKVYLTGVAILIAIMNVNYFPEKIFELLKGMTFEMQVIFKDYLGMSIFFITANSCLIAVISRHAVIQPFFLVQMDETLMAKLDLTNREREIINLLIEGFTKREVGDRLFISEFTVKTHIQNIYAKLGVSNRVELTNYIKDQLAARKAS